MAKDSAALVEDRAKVQQIGFALNRKRLKEPNPQAVFLHKEQPPLVVHHVNQLGRVERNHPRRPGDGRINPRGAIVIDRRNRAVRRNQERPGVVGEVNPLPASVARAGINLNRSVILVGHVID